jgi:hypothetical protein
MTTPRWQFSLRALLVLTALVAVVAAIVANYPWIALLIAGGTLWMMFETGMIFNIVAALSEPAAYARHPFLAAITGSVAGIVSFAIGGFFIWLAIANNSSFRKLMGPLLFAAISVGFGVFCFRLVWLAFKGSSESDDT